MHYHFHDTLHLEFYLSTTTTNAPDKLILSYYGGFTTKAFQNLTLTNFEK